MVLSEDFNTNRNLIHRSLNVITSSMTKMKMILMIRLMIKEINNNNRSFRIIVMIMIAMMIGREEV